MPRRSAASLSIARPELGKRPSPPSVISDRQRALWVQIVSAKPPEWFGQDNLPILAALVAHIETFELIEREFRGASDLGSVDKLLWLDRLTKMRERETRAIASLSTKLRLTNQSRYDAKTANTAARERVGPAPWESPTRAAR